MAPERSLTIETLRFLQQFHIYGNGEYNNLAPILGSIDYKRQKLLLNYLQEEGFIKYCGGKLIGPLNYTEKDLELIQYDIPPVPRFLHSAFKGIITSKGSKLLKSMKAKEMNEQRDLFLETLQYLEAFYGDGALHSLDELFMNVSEDAKFSILNELKRDNYIEYRGGRFIWFGFGYYTPEEQAKNTSPLEGRITRKGIDYLSNLISKMKQEEKSGGVHFNNINGSNIIFNSSGATITVNNANEPLAHVHKIIETLRSATDIEEQQRQDMLMTMYELKAELRTGKVQQPLVDQVSLWANIASIGSFVQALLVALPA